MQPRTCSKLATSVVVAIVIVVLPPPAADAELGFDGEPAGLRHRLRREVKPDRAGAAAGQRDRLGTEMALQMQYVAAAQLAEVGPFELGEPEFRIAGVELADRVHRRTGIPIGPGGRHQFPDLAGRVIARM